MTKIICFQPTPDKFWSVALIINDLIVNMSIDLMETAQIQAANPFWHKIHLQVRYIE